MGNSQREVLRKHAATRLPPPHPHEPPPLSVRLTLIHRSRECELRRGLRSRSALIHLPDSVADGCHPELAPLSSLIAACFYARLTHFNAVSYYQYFLALEMSSLIRSPVLTNGL